MKNKRILCLLLASLILTASCGSTQTDNPKGGETTSGGGETTEAVTTDPGIVSKLTPELKEELGLDGYEFNVLLRNKEGSWSLYDFIATEETGDVLNDAAYKRNLWLEENCGFTLKADYSADTRCSEITTYILAGEDSYDAYFPMGQQAGAAASQGLLYNLKDLKYLDLESDCWNQMFSDSVEIAGKLFYATGAISTNSYDAVRVFFFNKTIADKYQLEDPYQLVRDGKWTFDKLNEMAYKCAVDLNGDTKMTFEDQFGLGWQSTIGTLVFLYGAGEKVTKNDSNRLPVLNLDSERFTEVFTKVRDTLSNHDVYYNNSDGSDVKMFYEERSLFLTEVLEVARRLRPYDVDFGVLPLPKWTEDQDEYIQYVDAWCISPVTVPKNNTNLDRTGFIIQAIAEASQKFLVDPYYDTVLTGKALRDEESSEMLDIAINNFVLDNADMFQWSGVINKLRDAMNTDLDLASYVATNKSAIEEAINKTLENMLG